MILFSFSCIQDQKGKKYKTLSDIVDVQDRGGANYNASNDAVE